MSLKRVTIEFKFLPGRIAAFCCGTVLLLIALVYAMAWAATAINMIDNASSQELSGGVRAGYVFGTLVQLFPVFCFGAGFGRFLLRLSPPYLSGKPRPGLFVVAIPLAAVCTFFTGAFLLRLIHSADSPEFLLKLSLIPLFLLTWIAGFTAILITGHVIASSLLNKPFVLFLRRFSQFSDRSVINLILKKAPPGNPIVFLVPTRSRAGDWNPFLLGFAGMKIFHPFRTVPIFVKWSDDDWKGALRPLLKRAGKILIDVSSGSSSIQTEIEFINQDNLWPKTIVLNNDRKEREGRQLQALPPAGARMVSYRKSWVRGIPRMILGFIVLWCAFTVLVIFVVSINHPLVNGSLCSLCHCRGYGFMSHSLYGRR